MSNTEKEHITSEFEIFEIVQVPNFSLTWIFWISDLKKKKSKSPLNSPYSN